jgi:hypothetical protein
MKTFTVAGTSTQNGTTKVRFANDYVGRTKTLVKNGHTDVVLIELGSEMSKAEICKVLMGHPQFQTEAQQTAITNYVVQNLAELKQELVATAVVSEDTADA